MSIAARAYRTAFAVCVLAALPLPAPAITNAATARRTPSNAYANAMRRVNPRLGAPISRLYAAALLSDARRMSVDPTLVMAVVTVESHWNSAARSYRGAIGLGQLMPGTARNLGVDARSGPANLAGLTAYLHRLLARFRDAREPIREAIAGYNAGPLAVERYGGVPPYGETRRYVVKVLAAWHSFKTRLPSNLTALRVAKELSAADVEAKAQTTYWGAL